ncbi:MAG: DnaB-like helicase C-terminal domain-containing protein, partial [Elusimicrobiaceae bacterium]|nr:DnaB-like helicase C-terminal domain-containing protein [Elusimicrobiaceae bacterium]
LARTMNVPVLALSQLNRNTEKGRADNRPQLSDLRESGSIEQDADVVALIHREGYYKWNDESLRNKANLILAKQRNGPVGTIDLNWYSEYTLFTNPALVTDEEAAVAMAAPGDIPL